MNAMTIDPARIRGAWQGRVSGCMLGKPLEVLSFEQGFGGVTGYLQAAAALLLRDYVPLVEGAPMAHAFGNCCRGRIVRAEPDDDINYTFLALLLLERYGTDFDTTDVVARTVEVSRGIETRRAT